MAFVEKIQIRYRPEDTNGAWSYMEIPPTQTTVDIKGVAPGSSYRVEARSMSSCGALSDWVSVSHTVNGVPDNPDAPTNLTATGVADGVALAWGITGNLPTDVHFEVWVAPDNGGVPGTYVLATGLRAFSYTYPAVDAIYRWYRVRGVTVQGGASNWSNAVRAQATSLANLSSQVAQALQEAQNAKAASDHLIVIYYRTTSTGITASYGDVWVDTDSNDGTGTPLIYRWDGQQWNLAVNDALVDALKQAITGNAKADGKVQTFYQATPPPPSTGTGSTHPPYPLGLGDLWFNTTTSQLYRWDGTAWSQNMGDVTLDQLSGTGVNILWDEYATLNSGSLPSFTRASTVTLAYDATVSYANTDGSLKASISDAGGGPTNSWIYFGNSSTDYNLKLTPGKRYIVSAYLRSTVTTGAVSLRLRGSDGVIYPTGSFVDQSITAANTWVRVSAVLDLSAVAINSGVLLFYLNRKGLVAPYTVWIDRVMVEEQVGNKTTPSAWTPGAAGRQALIAIANAAVAKSTADGKIQVFTQTSAPTNSTKLPLGVGDIWFDTDDGNKCYTWNGSAWAATPDSRIAQAILDAAGAQATADGKIQVFYKSTTPTTADSSIGVIGVGDLWYNPDTGELKRWSGSAWQPNGVSRAPVSGSNLIPNPTFDSNMSGLTASVNTALNKLVADNWIVTYDYSKTAGQSSSATFLAWHWTGFSGAGLTLQVGNPINLAANTLVAAQVRTLRPIAVRGGANYVIDFDAVRVYNGSHPAGINMYSRMVVQWNDANGAGITNSLIFRARETPGGPATYTAPANAVSAYIFLDSFVQNLSGATWSHDSTIALRTNFTAVTMREVANLDVHVEDGTDFYGRYALDDGWVTGGLRRIGLRFGASYQQFGDARNMRRVQNSSYVMTRTTTALSATSAGAVSVLAHTVRYGSVSISYSAVTNAVTGLTPGNRYVIYCLDPGYAGGVRAWSAAVSPDAAMNVSPDVVIAGEITIPTSGTSTGGGGSGTIGPGSDWCVDWDTYLPDGRLVRTLQVGDMVECWDNNPDTPCREPVAVQAIAFGEEASFRLVSETGASIIQSKSTPMSLRDGRTVTTQEMLHEHVLVWRDNTLRWERVIRLTPVGVRRVIKVNLGDRMFFAGETRKAWLATHNSMMKP